MAMWVGRKQLGRRVRPVGSMRKGNPSGRGEVGAEQMVQLLWRAIGKDVAVQRRVMELLEEARRDGQVR